MEKQPNPVPSQNHQNGCCNSLAASFTSHRISRFPHMYVTGLDIWNPPPAKNDEPLTPPRRKPAQTTLALSIFIPTYAFAQAHVDPNNSLSPPTWTPSPAGLHARLPCRPIHIFLFPSPPSSGTLKCRVTKRHCSRHHTLCVR